MSTKPALAPCCRLCLAETANKVPVFGRDEANVINLLVLIELDIDPDAEPDAAVCFNCIVTLEGFYQFKEQCHVNDEIIKDRAMKSDDEEKASKFGFQSDDEGEDEAMNLVSFDGENSEEEGLVEDLEPTVPIPTIQRKTPTNESTDCSVEAKRPKIEQRSQPRARSRSSTAKGSKKIEKISKTINMAIMDKMLVLKDSYPDYFHFERSRRNVNYTLVFYGERYNSAIYKDMYTTWKCANRRRFKCPALVNVSNDYFDFERCYEHTHGKVEDSLETLQLYTPRQALPEIFKICRQTRLKRKIDRHVNREKLEKWRRRGMKDVSNVIAEEIVELQQVDGETLIRVMHEDDEDSLMGDGCS